MLARVSRLRHFASGIAIVAVASFSVQEPRREARCENAKSPVASPTDVAQVPHPTTAKTNAKSPEVAVTVVVDNVGKEVEAKKEEEEEEEEEELDEVEDAKWEEEKEKCDFCKMFLGSPCKEQFKKWSRCVDKAKQNEKDFVSECTLQTERLLDCTSENNAFFSPPDGTPKSDDLDEDSDGDAKEQSEASSSSSGSSNS